MSSNSPTRDASFRQVQIEEGIVSPPKEFSIMDYIQKYIEKGSINECVINLCIISFGVGLLALPQKVQYVTLVFTPIMIVICAVINYWTFSVLGEAARKLKVNKYEDIVAGLFNPWFSYFFIFMTCFGLFCTIILFQVILYKFIGGIINEVFSYGFVNMEIFSLGSFWSEQKMRLMVCYGLAIFVFFPLGMIKTFSQMRYVTAFGIVSIFLIIFIVVIQCPSFFYHNVIDSKMGSGINILDFGPGFEKDLKFITSISTIIYAYECHASIFPAIASLTNPTEERVNTVFKRAASINGISYVIITLAGYLSQPRHTPDLILEREKISDTDYLMTLGLILFSLTIMTKIGALFNCLRSLILNVMKYDLENYPTSINIILIITVFSLSTFVAATFQNISDYISLIGSFYGMFIAVVMPGIIYIKFDDRPMYKKYLALAFIAVFCSIGALTVYFTLEKIFRF